MKRGARLALVLTCALLAGHVGGSYGVELFDLILHWNVYVSGGFPPVLEVLAAPLRVPLWMSAFPAAWWVAYLIAFALSVMAVASILMRVSRPRRQPNGFAVTPATEQFPEASTERSE